MVSILKCLNLHNRNDKLLINSLIIFSYIIMLYFIALFLMFIISLFTKTNNNNNITEGNRNRRQREREREQREAKLRQEQACMFPTAANFIACGPKYYFPNSHLEPSMAATRNAHERKINRSTKADKGITSELHGKLKL